MNWDFILEYYILTLLDLTLQLQTVGSTARQVSSPMTLPYCTVHIPS